MPKYSQSITTPQGDIYLLGGNDENDQKSDLVYKLDFNSSKFIPIGKMITARSSFAVCYLNNSIYIIGGILQNSEITTNCERFDLNTNQSIELPALNYPSHSSLALPFVGKIGKK